MVPLLDSMNHQPDAQVEVPEGPRWHRRKNFKRHVFFGVGCFLQDCLDVFDQKVFDCVIRFIVRINRY